jgi:threonine dehydrogenase-like Zn-dependent dehydrogenase
MRDDLTVTIWTPAGVLGVAAAALVTGSMFEHVWNGYLKPSDVITHRIPLEHIAEGYHIFPAKPDDCIKPLIVTDAA